MPSPSPAALLVLLALATACVERQPMRLDPDQSRVETIVIPKFSPPELDLLIVVDDSPSMADERAALAANARQFVNVLDNFEGGLPSLHLGVITTDLGGDGPGCAGRGDAGLLQRAEACGVDGTFVRIDGVGGRNNLSRDLAGTVACMVDVGTDGCEIEQPLAALDAALADDTRNVGFVRPEAQLFVLFITDDDDCSVADPAWWSRLPAGARDRADDFACFADGVVCAEGGDPAAPGPRTGCRPAADGSLRGHQAIARLADRLMGLKARPLDVMVAVISGDAGPIEVGKAADADGRGRPALQPSCSYRAALDRSRSGPQTARPAVRLQAFADLFPNRSTVTSLCDNDLSDALVQLADLLAVNLGNPCIQGVPVDVDEERSGTQPSCQLSWFVDYRGPDQVETPLAPCSAVSGLPCWRPIDDPNCTDYPSGISVEVVTDQPWPRRSTVVAQCLVE